MPSRQRTQLNATKLHAVAEFARFCVRNPDLLEDNLIPQTLGIAIRKLHDHGSSPLGTGKYLGHPCWSRQARSLLRKGCGNVDEVKHELAHEHVVPVKLIVAELLALPRRTSTDEFEAIIRKLSLVAIITRKEDAEILRKVKLRNAPTDRWFESDPWWRYRQSGLLARIITPDGKRVDA